MKKETSLICRLDKKLDRIAAGLQAREIKLPADLVGACLFFVIAVILFSIMPKQVMVSETDVVNGRVFPTMLMILIMFCSGILILQNIYKILKKEPMNTCTLNLLTEVKALIILAILFVTYILCRWTNLFAVGTVFCALGFLVYFRCRKKAYYGITVSLAVLIWAAFRFGLGVRF